MVALAVRYLGQQPVSCNARPLLFQADAAIKRGALIEAGCLLREAVRLFLIAECEFEGCLPKKKRRRSPTALLIAIRKAGHCDHIAFEWLAEIIGHCNTLAHCGDVRPTVLEDSINAVHQFLDAATHLVQPVAAGRLQ